ncbi:MAG: hypothetical protein CVU90_00895 [Firmicutes bacterium HGW-Firmicutes-15]|nr:MAG: hypothetical protein CVU90_00895 [Firmicutes bacterium HGW-Firmicutes-15]
MQDLVQININLLKREDVYNSRLLYWGLGFVIMAIIGVMTGVGYMSLSKDLKYQQAVNADLKSEYQKYDNEMVALTPILEMKKEIDRKSQEVINIQKEQVSFSDVISEIDKVLPPEVIMLGVDIKAQKVVVTGFSPDHSQVARLLKGLKGSFRFNNVTILSKMDEKTDEAKFTIELTLEAEKK